MLQTFRIDNVQPGSARARIVRIALDGGAFEFRAGQALALADHGHERRRAYSIAVAPADVRRDGVVELLIGVDEHGNAGPHLTLAAGTLVDVEGPIGDFALPGDVDCNRVVFVAGGTGIAPLRAMLREALDGPRELCVIYSARTSADFAYGDELRALADAGRIVLRQTVTRHLGCDEWRGSRGRICVKDLAVSDLRSAMYVLCGPPAMVRGVNELLQALATPADRIVMEEWCRRLPAPAPVSAAAL